ncbi:Arm DNA-binding domain-containing protein [Propionivibrio sp.]|uniref:Arm DNA-binding domain-containing protein n=1 Tax=Propionivibrio sp. TaxID=2212460 RepID=UPI003BF36AF2
MAKVKFTAGRVAGFKCEDGKSQAFLWCANSPGLAVRATGTGAKAYIFQSRVDGNPLRMTIGDVKTWGIDAAQVEARRLQTLIDNGDDPRQIKTDKREAGKAAAAAQSAKALRESVTLADAWPAYLTDRVALADYYATAKDHEAKFAPHLLEQGIAFRRNGLPFDAAKYFK